MLTSCERQVCAAEDAEECIVIDLVALMRARRACTAPLPCRVTSVSVRRSFAAGVVVGIDISKFNHHQAAACAQHHPHTWALGATTVPLPSTSPFMSCCAAIHQGRHRGLENPPLRRWKVNIMRSRMNFVIYNNEYFTTKRRKMAFNKNNLQLTIRPSSKARPA